MFTFKDTLFSKRLSPSNPSIQHVPGGQEMVMDLVGGNPRSAEQVIITSQTAAPDSSQSQASFDQAGLDMALDYLGLVRKSSK